MKQKFYKRIHTNSIGLPFRENFFPIKPKREKEKERIIKQNQQNILFLFYCASFVCQKVYGDWGKHTQKICKTSILMLIDCCQQGGSSYFSFNFILFYFLVCFGPLFIKKEEEEVKG